MAKKSFTPVRILVATPVDGITYHPDQVVEFDPSTANHLADQGAVDKHKDAVAYAHSQGAKTIRHLGPEEDPEPVADNPDPAAAE